MEVSEEKIDCRSFGSNIQPSRQSRKISIAVMADSVAKTTYGTMKGELVVIPNTERVISNGANFDGNKSRVEGVKCSQSAKSVNERKSISATSLPANQASDLQVFTGRPDIPDGVECAPGPFSNQISNLHSSNYNLKKIDTITSKMKGKKDGIPERVEDITFTIPQEVLESEKTKLQNRTNKTENRTENLRMKLRQVLGTMPSPKTHHLGPQTCNMNDERLPPGQHFDQKDEFDKIKQKCVAMETDENTDHTNTRPVTRSWNRKIASARMQPSKSKRGSPSRDKEKHQEKVIFSFEERRTGKRSAILNDNYSMSLMTMSQRKNSRISPRKICFPANDTADKPCQKPSQTDITPRDVEIFSLGNKMGGSYRCLSDHQEECSQSENIIQEQKFHQSPTTKEADQHRELVDSENGNNQEDKSPIVENVAGPKNNFQSLMFRIKTPTLSSSPSSTPKMEQKASDVSSPASTETERRFSLGTIRNFRTFKTSETGCNKHWAQRLQDTEELKDYFPRKATYFVKEKEAQDGRSDSSSEERSFQGSQEGTRERHITEKQTSMLNPIKKLCKNEDIKFIDNSPASPSSKGTVEIDGAYEASEQNQEDGFVRAVELFASEFKKVKSKLESVTSQKSSEILMSIAEEIQLQLQDVHSKIQTDTEKLTNLSKSKRKRLETSIEGHQKQLRLIHEKFKEEVNLHLRDCKSTVEGLESDLIEIKGVLEKQRASHRKLLSQVEDSVEIQLNDAQRKITAIQELGKGKLIQLKHVVATCLREGMLS